MDLSLLSLTFLLGYAAYLDITNDRTIPNRVVYLSLLFSLTLYFVKLLLGLATLDGLWIAGLSFMALYALFRLGLMGEAEAFYVAMLSLHVPYASFLGLPMPLILPLFFYASLAFGFFLSLKGLWLVIKYKKWDWRYLLLPPLYVGAVVNLQTVYPLPPEVHLLFLLTLLVGLTAPSLKEAFKAEIEVEKAEGEIPVEGPPVLLRKHIKEMLKEGRGKVLVYKYPPFLPFLLLAFLYLYSKGF